MPPLTLSDVTTPPAAEPIPHNLITLSIFFAAPTTRELMLTYLFVFVLARAPTGL